jgi:hypothetical protein
MVYNVYVAEEIRVKVGDMVNYTGRPFDGPSVSGLILESKVHLDVDNARAKQNVNTHKIFWGSHSMINWVLEKNLKVVA